MLKSKPRERNKFQPGNKFGKGRVEGSRNVPRPKTREQLLDDIEIICKNAVENNQWQAALQARVWQGKLMGFFRTRKLPPITQISDMQKHEIEELLAVLEENDPELKKLKEGGDLSFKT